VVSDVPRGVKGRRGRRSRTRRWGRALSVKKMEGFDSTLIPLRVALRAHAAVSPPFTRDSATKLMVRRCNK